MNKWKNRTVGFDTTNQEEMELYQFSVALPNFTHMVKDWLRNLMGGSETTWQHSAVRTAGALSAVAFLAQMDAPKRNEDASQEITEDHMISQFI